MHLNDRAETCPWKSICLWKRGWWVLIFSFTETKKKNPCVPRIKIRFTLSLCFTEDKNSRNLFINNYSLNKLCFLRNVRQRGQMGIMFTCRFTICVPSWTFTFQLQNGPPINYTTLTQTSGYQVQFISILSISISISFIFWHFSRSFRTTEFLILDGKTFTTIKKTDIRQGFLYSSWFFQCDRYDKLDFLF